MDGEHHRFEAAVNGGRYIVSPFDHFPSMKFAGYTAEFWPDGATVGEQRDIAVPGNVMAAVTS